MKFPVPAGGESSQFGATAREEISAHVQDCVCDMEWPVWGSTETATHVQRTAGGVCGEARVGPSGPCVSKNLL